MRITIRWKIDEAMVEKTTKQQLRKLKDECLTKSALKVWLVIGEEKKRKILENLIQQYV